jgi:hypothetical protein
VIFADWYCYSRDNIHTYHAQPVRLLTRAHYPEGFLRPRVITDWGVSPAFPPAAPTVEEFYKMFYDRELADDEVTDNESIDNESTGN